MILFKTHKGYLLGCGRILYVDVIFALKLVAVNLSNYCKMQNLYVNCVNVLYLQVTVTNINKNR